MSDFKGFTDAETFTQVPDSFFRLLLKEIKDIDELKVTLYAVWQIQHMEGPFRAMSESDFDAKALGLSADRIRRGLKKTIERGTLLEARDETDLFYFLNSPRGRATADAFSKGQLRESGRIMTPMVERPNIFKLYEENIGPLTPLIADALKDAEETYAADWIAESIELAVKNNKRNWRYCEAILKRWKEEGRGEKQDRRDAEKDRRKYIEGEYSDYIEH
ncbi:MAG TPA: DnaD domain protein [Anaerolineales bacterium]|nr:DnaD domain protein [Anaerolineales bacterium]